MAKRQKTRYMYTIDVENNQEHFGVWNLKSFDEGDLALSYAKSLAKANPELTVTISVECLNPTRVKHPR